MPPRTSINPKAFAAALARVFEKSKSPRPFDELPAVVVACSAGVDSMALLDLVRAHYESRRQLSKLAVCHLDHGQRAPKEHARDAELVREYCRRHKLPLALERLGTAPGSSEAALRNARYERLSEVAARYPGADGEPAIVLTAHHQDDDLETLLFRLVRGAHPDTLKGIAPRARRKGGLRVARPLLASSKSDLVEYARSRKLAWHEDTTNTSPRHARNRIRHELVPLLESLRPGATRRLARFLAESRPRRPRCKVSTDELRQLTAQLQSGEGCPVDTLAFIPLKAALDTLLDEHAGRTTRAHWDSLKRQLRARQASRKGGGPEKTIQFPGKNALRFQGTRAFWISNH